MQHIVLKAIQHQGAECIGIYFNYDIQLNALIKQIAGIKWSKTHSCWYLPYNDSNYELIISTLSPFAFTNEIPIKRANKAEGALLKQPVKPVLKTGINETGIISEENNKALSMLVQQLKLKAYSPSTIKTYKNEFSQLLKTIKQKDVNTLTLDDLRRYMVYVLDKEGISENTAHSRLNALKFYFEQVLGREKFLFEIPRPKKPLLLPKLLNEKELGRLFNALTNKKHKAMLFTAYSAGLRVSEIVALKLSDIDSCRMQILVRQAKGKKDRYVNLSPVLLDILRKYISTYQPKPKEYLFESEQTHTCYPTRTVQQIFMNAKRKAGITKDVGVHSLRHSFATHLLDKGTDIRYIKELLGHFDIKTTERYLHVSKRNLVNIISPLDDLMKQESIEW